MTAAPIARSARGGNAAIRGLWLWDLLFVLATTTTAVLVMAEEEPLVRRLAATALVLACGLGWAALGRGFAAADTPGDRPAVTGYAAVLVGCLAGAVALVGSAQWATFVVLSQLFWLLTLARAIGATVLVTLLLPVVSAVARGGGAVQMVQGLAPQAVFMTAFGVLVGIFIHRVSDESEERGRLIAELEASQTQVAELSHTAGAAAERERLAGEIHDTLAQGFTSIVTLLQAAQAEFDTDAPAARRHVDLAVRSAKENLQEARHLVAASTPNELTTRSLTDAVGRQVERFAEETGVDAGHGATGLPRKLGAEQEIVLLRAAQELLANVARHAGAQTVGVRLDFTYPEEVELTVADDGVGFDPHEVGDGSYGLAMMRGRVERLGGELLLDTAPTEGTTATVRLPTGAP